MYVEAWQEQAQQQQRQDPSNTTSASEKARIWFLDNEECQTVIHLVEPRLLPHFQTETIGIFKGDVCRAAALYLSGGYYFDVDMEAIQPLSLPRTTSFSSAVTNDLRFFNSFMAAAPGHVVVYNSLQIMLQYYELRQHLVEKQKGKRRNSFFDRTNASDAFRAQVAAIRWNCGTASVANFDLAQEIMVNHNTSGGGKARPAVCNMIEGGLSGLIGCFSLKAAYDFYSEQYSKARAQQLQEEAQKKLRNSLYELENNDVVLLYEDDYGNLSRREVDYPNLTFQVHGEGAGCNFLVHSRNPPLAYFFSRMVGSSDWYCAWKNESIPPPPPEGENEEGGHGINNKDNLAPNNEWNLNVEYFHVPMSMRFNTD